MTGSGDCCDNQGEKKFLRYYPYPYPTAVAAAKAMPVAPAFPIMLVGRKCREWRSNGECTFAFRGVRLPIGPRMQMQKQDRTVWDGQGRLPAEVLLLRLFSFTPVSAACGMQREGMNQPRVGWKLIFAVFV
jgi:hypothetical protein